MPHSPAFITKQWVNGKYMCTGNFYGEGLHNRTLYYLFDVKVANPESKYLVYIFPTMLSPEGGDFDDADTIFVDIYSIDNLRRDYTHGYGGVWGGNHFGALGLTSNMGISSYIGFVGSFIRFRIAITGDDWVGASFVIMEL